MRRLILIATLMLSPVCSFAEQLVDPAAVAPEYRAAAEKRRAEQLKIHECQRKASEALVQVRDRAAFVAKCLDHAEAEAR